MINKVLISFMILAVFTSFAYAAGSSYYYSDSGSSEDSSYYYSEPSGGSSYYYSEPYSYQSYYDTDRTYFTFYYSSPYTYSYYSNYPYSYYDYYNYNNYNSYSNYYGCNGARTCYYGPSTPYTTYSGFQGPDNNVYGGPVNNYIDPITPPPSANPICKNPNGNQGDVRIFGVNTKAQFECNNGAWTLITAIPTPDAPSTGSANKFQFYGGYQLVQSP